MIDPSLILGLVLLNDPYVKQVGFFDTKEVSRICRDIRYNDDGEFLPKGSIICGCWNDYYKTIIVSLPSWWCPSVRNTWEHEYCHASTDMVKECDDARPNEHYFDEYNDLRRSKNRGF